MFKFIIYFQHTIVRTDTSGFITPEDQNMMMQSVDQLIDMGMYAQGDLIPKYQTHVMLFQEDAPPIWKKLKKTFHDACETYLKAVPDFCRNQDCIEFTASGAWAYKGWKSINAKEGNPWHHHNPAFLSGVYYLKFLVMRAQSFMTQEQQRHMEQGFNQFLHKSSHGLSFLVGYLIRVFKQIVKNQGM
jgi:hypothetical protein